MTLSKKYIKVKANSLLESVIAITIISISIYVSVLIINQVFSKSTSEKFYIEDKKMNELFYKIQFEDDTIPNSTNFSIETENLKNGLIKYDIKYLDSTKLKLKSNFIIDNSTNEN